MGEEKVLLFSKKWKIVNIPTAEHFGTKDFGTCIEQLECTFSKKMNKKVNFKQIM